MFITHNRNYMTIDLISDLYLDLPFSLKLLVTATSTCEFHHLPVKSDDNEDNEDDEDYDNDSDDDENDNDDIQCCFTSTETVRTIRGGADDDVYNQGCNFLYA